MCYLMESKVSLYIWMRTVTHYYVCFGLNKASFAASLYSVRSYDGCLEYIAFNDKTAVFRHTYAIIIKVKVKVETIIYSL